MLSIHVSESEAPLIFLIKLSLSCYIEIRTEQEAAKGTNCLRLKFILLHDTEHIRNVFDIEQSSFIQVTTKSLFLDLQSFFGGSDNVDILHHAIISLFLIHISSLNDLDKVQQISVSHPSLHSSRLLYSLPDISYSLYTQI